MRRMFGTLVLFAAAGQFGHGQQLTPRDAFWSASDLVSVSPNPATKKPTKTAAVSATSRASKPATAGRTADSEAMHVNPELVSADGYGAQPHLLRVSASATRLGLRYSLLLRNADGAFEEVSPKTTFHSGDHVRLSIMANEPGYLYVIQQGSSGNWSPIFPIAGSAENANRVEQGRVYQVPDGEHAFAFDQHAGDEKMFVILSRQPVRDLQSTIEGLRGGGHTATPAPVTTKPAAPQGQMLEAANRIPDDLVQRLASRDLTLVSEQQVDQAPTTANSGEKAVYVVAKSSGTGSAGEVVTRISLRHE